MSIIRKRIIVLTRYVFGRIFKFRYFEEMLINENSFFYKWRGLLMPSWTSYDNPTFRSTVLHGINFTLNISDYMDWKAYFRVGLEESKAVFHRTKTDHVILDVGANLGYYALHFAKAVPNGQVFCFEPDPDNFKKLSTNIDQNQFDNIHLLNYGLGEEDGTFYLGVIDQDNTGMNSIISEKDKETISHSTIRIKKLDDIEVFKDIKRVDIVKVDIEGYEHHFLNGAKETLMKHYPLIFMELCDEHLKRQGSSATDVILLLQDYGYNSIVNTKNQKVQLDEAILNGCQFDIFCTKIY